MSTKRLREGERRMQEGAQRAKEAQQKHSNECIKAQGGCREGWGWPERHGMSTTGWGGSGEGVQGWMSGQGDTAQLQQDCGRLWGGRYVSDCGGIT